MRLVLLFMLLAANAALAHDSIAPHDHPHGLLPNFDVMIAVALLAALAFIVFDRVRRGG